MTTHCCVCGKFVSMSECVKCFKCTLKGHRSCMFNSNPDTKSAARSLCKNCKTKTNVNKNMSAAGSDGSSGSVQSSPGLCDAEELSVAQNITQLREEFSNVTREISLFRQEMSRLTVLLNEFNSRIERVENRVDQLEKTTEERITSLESSGPTHLEESLREKITELKQELNERDRLSLRCDIVLSGIPEEEGENAMHLATSVAHKIGVTLEEKDVVFAERLGLRRKPVGQTSRPIILRLLRHSTRDEILHSARVRRDIDTTGLNLNSDTPPSKIYLNERLTRYDKHLFSLAKQAAVESGWKYVWTRDGRVLARQSPTARVRRIICEKDIQSVFV
ncbi:unnamed protein product [Leptosia nina]|uniref:FP protein C-terminal domain-containing protein n=1 Tax=Leptosia nina TaxID=320188 RepID=A0AAV1JU16_9NEOP